MTGYKRQHIKNVKKAEEINDRLLSLLKQHYYYLNYDMHNITCPLIQRLKDNSNYILCSNTDIVETIPHLLENAHYNIV